MTNKLADFLTDSSTPPLRVDEWARLIESFAEELKPHLGSMNLKRLADISQYSNREAAKSISCTLENHPSEETGNRQLEIRGLFELHRFKAQWWPATQMNPTEPDKMTCIWGLSREGWILGWPDWYESAFKGSQVVVSGIRLAGTSLSAEELITASGLSPLHVLGKLKEHTSSWAHKRQESAAEAHRITGKLSLTYDMVYAKNPKCLRK